MTDKELISKLQTLKQIKPRKDWVSLSKMSILGAAATVKPAPFYKSTFSSFSRLVSQKKFAYSFAVLLFVFAGVWGALGYVLPSGILNQANNGTQATSGIASVENFKSTSQALAQAVKSNKPNDIVSAAKNVKVAASNLTVAIKKDPSLTKDVASSLKYQTLLDVPGDTDLQQTSDTLYQTIDQQMIADLQKTSLTASQQEILAQINDLYNQGQYSNALVEILSINNNIPSN